MLRNFLFLNRRHFCIEVIIGPIKHIKTNKSIKPNKPNKHIKPTKSIKQDLYVNTYEIAESEEIDIQKIENSNNSSKKKSKWGDVTINME